MDLAALPTLATALVVGPVSLPASLLVSLLVAVLAVSVAGRRRLEREVRASHAELVALRERLDALAGSPDGTSVRRDHDRQEYLITSLPEHAGPATPGEGHDGAAAALPAREFASVALAESVVRVASLAYGVRRALSAENRNRIRFEMGREVKRARRQRRRDLKEAKRLLRANPDLSEDAA
jgi:hypothetical protein